MFDIDGTLTTGEDVWGPLIHSSNVTAWRKIWLYGSGLPHYVLSKLRVANQARFRERWVRLMAWLMTDWRAAQVAAACKSVVHDALLPHLRHDMVEVLRAHQESGHHTVLVTTMFQPIAERFAQQVGADKGIGTRLRFSGDAASGRIDGETCSGARKLAFASIYLSERFPDMALESCAAYADSRSDIPFLAGVGFPAAVYPDATMRQAAEQHGWPVIDA
ncbi:MAG: HAD-IB family hydrolase [Rhodocyclaceae bacterium]|nr:HAD-IB family hydrolase [Rhodocyclaceae bacterium]